MAGQSAAASGGSAGGAGAVWGRHGQDGRPAG